MFFYFYFVPTLQTRDMINYTFLTYLNLSNYSLPAKVLWFTTFFNKHSYLFKKKNKKFLKKTPTDLVLEKFLNFFIFKGRKLPLVLFFNNWLTFNKLNTPYSVGPFLLNLYVQSIAEVKEARLIKTDGLGIRFFLSQLLLSTVTSFFTKINPIFIFRFNRIDKRIRKYSRGKSGKYKCVFKYLPSYKRLSFLFLILRRDLLLSKDLKFFSKMHALLNNFFFNSKSLIFNIKKFSNFFFINNIPLSKIK